MSTWRGGEGNGEGRDKRTEAGETAAGLPVSVKQISKTAWLILADCAFVVPGPHLRPPQHLASAWLLATLTFSCF